MLKRKILLVLIYAAAMLVQGCAAGPMAMTPSSDGDWSYHGGSDLAP